MMRFHLAFCFITVGYALIFTFFLDFSGVVHQKIFMFYGVGLLLLFLFYIGSKFYKKHGTAFFFRWNSFVLGILCFFLLLGFCFHRDYFHFLQKKAQLFQFSNFVFHQKSFKNDKNPQDNQRSPKIWRGIVRSDHHFNGRHFVLRMNLLAPVNMSLQGSTFFPWQSTKWLPKGALIEIRTKGKPPWLLTGVEVEVDFYKITWLSDLSHLPSDGYQNYLISKDIVALGYAVAEDFRFISDQAHFFQNIKRKILFFIENQISRYLSVDVAGLAMALMTGEKNFLSKEMRNRFIQTGTYHVLAVSGLHVGLWSILFFHFFRFLGFSLRFSSLFILLGILPFFLFLTTAPVSALRSYLLVLIGGFLFWSNRSINTLKLLIVIFFSFLFFTNEGFLWLYSLSFQLSFSSVFAIFLTFPLLNKFYSKRFEKFIKFFMISIVCQMATFPFVFYTFGRLHFLSPFYNFFVVPLIFLFLFFLSFFLFTTPFGWGDYMSYGVEMIGQTIFKLLDFTFLDNSFFFIDFSEIFLSPFPFLIFGILFFSLLFLFYIRHLKDREVLVTDV